MPPGREDGEPVAQSAGLVEDGQCGQDVTAAGLRCSEGGLLTEHPALWLPAPGPEGPPPKGRGRQAKADLHTWGCHFSLVTWSMICL